MRLLYFLTDLLMSSATLLILSNVRKNTDTVIGRLTVLGLVDEGFMSPEPHRWTMSVEQGFLRKKVRYIRNPYWNPQIPDMIYALQNRS